jgi:hypothetical protein
LGRHPASRPNGGGQLGGGVAGAIAGVGEELVQVRSERLHVANAFTTDFTMFLSSLMAISTSRLIAPCRDAS